ncbi:MAG: hypothetical protein AD742_14025 [Methylibium sp. NZG]|nr:MAG: hypothetical protein AD742_14025 [Methylibium sp. NZG]
MSNPSAIKRERRRFLLGSGGAALALPLLPSLFARDAAAQSAGGQKAFVHMLSWHGGVCQRNMYPPAATQTERLNYAGHEVRRGALAPSTVSGQTQISDVLRAPSTALPAGMVAKMNVLNGVDIPFYIGHNRSQGLGNFADSDQADDAVRSGGRRMTIDQIMAWSPTFYPDLARVRERAMVLGNSSWTWSNPANRSGTLQRTGRTAQSNLELFDKLFGTTTTATRPLVVDQVLESYRQLRNGNARLSAADKQRLDDHVQRIFELQRKLQLATGAPPAKPTLSTDSVRSPAGFEISPDRQVQAQGLMNDIVVAAISTGVSRICVTTHDETFSSYAGDWHQDIAHQSSDRLDAQTTITTASRRFFNQCVLDLANKLNAVSAAGGGTALDQSLLVWTHESGNYTHDSTSVPIITFGSAGGALRTGQYLDYRNLNKGFGGTAVQMENRWHGLLMHQWCGTMLQAMGIPKNGYENLAQNGGYPDFRYDQLPGWARYPGAEAPYPSAVWSATGDMLPWLRA